MKLQVKQVKQSRPGEVQCPAPSRTVRGSSVIQTPGRDVPAPGCIGGAGAASTASHPAQFTASWLLGYSGQGLDLSEPRSATCEAGKVLVPAP